MRLPTVHPVDGPAWSVRADVGNCPELELVLPARKEAVETPFLEEMREAARTAIYRAMAAADSAPRIAFQDWRHARAAGVELPAPAPGGRLVAVTSAGCMPGDAAWNTVFSPIEAPARVVFTMVIEGRAYARRGTTFDTRLTVIDRGEERGNAVIDPAARAANAEELLRAVIAGVPARLATRATCATVPTAPLRDLFGGTPAPGDKERKTTARNAH